MTTDTTIRFRLTGAIILIVLAVIFLPWLLDGAGYEQMSGIDEPVPPAPSFSEPDMALPSERPAVPRETAREVPASAEGEPRVAELHSLDDDFPATGEPEAPPAEPVEAEPEPAPEPAPAKRIEAGWAVQVGSFRDGDNAREEESRLRAQGLPAFIDESTVDGRSIFRVKVGPVARRDQALELGSRLEDGYDLPGIVVTHP